ncbi:growth hormone secretagogue receptor type 1-like [Haliotis rufescens]|uniref:growth hormone secretagogue receptor type 1-like n=1 Tax=Haliotis rufescens TaxID=6454 RepID=UPI001EAFB92F|nr:growth hormone secretagogue receptor type 1-like [Haliotis rufescens]
MELEDFTQYNVSVAIWTYIPPILIVIGTTGNILSIAVLSQTSMKLSTTSLYLRVLAVVDIVVLYTGLLRQWLLYLLDLDVRWMTESGCKIHTWIVYVVVHSSAWLLVAVTLERVLSVMFPHTVKMKCTRKAAYAIIAGILVLFLLLNAHYLYGIGDYYTQEGNETLLIPCDGITDGYYYFETTIWPWVDFCVYSFLPSTILIISNFCIIRTVFSSDREASNVRGYSGNATARRNKTSSMTMTLVVVSATYVICTTPFCVYTIYTNIFSEGLSPETQATRSLLWSLVNMLQYCNNSINFILYSVTGSRFRHELKGMFCKKAFVPRPTIYTMTTKSSSLHPVRQ